MSFKRLAFFKKRKLSDDVPVDSPVYESLQTPVVAEGSDQLTQSKPEFIPLNSEPVAQDLPASVRLDAQEQVQALISKNQRAGRFWQRRTEREETDAQKAGRLLEIQTNKPIRVLIGYLADLSSERTAREFASGVADRNVTSPFISYLGLQKCGTGYAYEIHEGGHGRSYLEPVLKYYAGLPPNTDEERTSVFIATSTRMVQLVKSQEGLVCVQLPESYTASETDWLIPTRKLKPIAGQNTALMALSGVFLAVGLISLIGAYAVRYQPYLPPPKAAHDRVSFDAVPLSQWQAMTSLAPGEYVKSLRYLSGNWRLQTAVAAAPVRPPETGKHDSMPPDVKNKTKPKDSRELTALGKEH